MASQTSCFVIGRGAIHECAAILMFPAPGRPQRVVPCQPPRLHRQGRTCRCARARWCADKPWKNVRPHLLQLQTHLLTLPVSFLILQLCLATHLQTCSSSRHALPTPTHSEPLAPGALLPESLGAPRQPATLHHTLALPPGKRQEGERGNILTCTQRYAESIVGDWAQIV